MIAWAAVMACLACIALEPRDRPLTAVRSAHYHLRTDLDRKEAEEIGRHMDLVLEEYERRFASFPVRVRGTLPLYLFRTRDAYLAHLRDCGHDGSGTVGAFYLGAGGDGLATYTDGQSRDMLLHTLQHEGFHQFAWVRLGKDLPSWINEGLAEYFGEAYMVKRRFVLGAADDFRLRRLRKAAEENRLVPFEHLATFREDEWEARATRGHDFVILYDQAWSMIHFLIEGEGGKHADRFVELLRAYAAELPPYPDLARALGHQDYAELETRWKAHLAALEPDPVSTAATRLAFLARGVQVLREEGVTPASLDELRQKLREKSFKARRVTHGGYTTLSAEDDSVFQVPPIRPTDPPTEWEWVPSRTPRVPPSLRATVAGTKVSVRWAFLGERGLVYRIDHE